MAFFSRSFFSGNPLQETRLPAGKIWIDLNLNVRNGTSTTKDASIDVNRRVLEWYAVSCKPRVSAVVTGSNSHASYFSPFFYYHCSEGPTEAKQG